MGKPGAAKCMKNCTPSKTQLCTQPQAIMEPVLQDAAPVGASLYCFEVYTKDTGTTKKSEELETLQYQYSKGLSVFACDEQDVFADVDVEVGQGLRTIKVIDAENDFHFAKRKETGAWVNTGLFSQVWRAIASGSLPTGSSKWTPTQFSFRAASRRSWRVSLCHQAESTWKIASTSSTAISAIWRCSQMLPSRPWSRRLTIVKPTCRSIGKSVSRTGSMGPWARICSRRLAWTSSVSAVSRLSTSQ